MSRLKTLALLLGFVALVAFGLLRLFNLGFRRGDVLPAYSVLRFDPLGCALLYQSLRDLDRYQVRRSTRPLPSVSGSPDTTLLVLGLSPIGDAETQGLDQIDRQLEQGSRVVLTFAGPSWLDAVEDEEPSDDDTTTPIELPDRWSLALDRVPLSRDDDGRARGDVALRAEGVDALPARLDWRTGWVLRVESDGLLSAPWRVLYQRAGRPVVAERRVAAGSLLVAADSFFLSNQGLLAERGDRHDDPDDDDHRGELIAHLLGGARQVAFEETHLGSLSSGGVMNLILRYRLHGVLLGLALSSALLVWRLSTPLVPEAPAARAPHEVLGRGATAGLAALMRRAVPEKRLAEHCVELWLRGRPGEHDSRERLLLVARGAPHPVVAYQRLARFLAERRKNR